MSKSGNRQGCQSGLGHQIMSRPLITVEPTVPLERLAALMPTQRPDAVLVIDEDGTVLGIVTEIDLLRETAPRRAMAAAVMSAPVVAVDLGTDLDQAREQMARSGVGHLVVLDETGRLAGIVSRDDLAAGSPPPDEKIRHETIDRVIDAGGEVTDVAVDAGVVRLRARVDSPCQAPVVEHLVQAVAGVLKLEDTFEYGIDELHDPAQRPSASDVRSH